MSATRPQGARHGGTQQKMAEQGAAAGATGNKPPVGGPQTCAAHEQSRVAGRLRVCVWQGAARGARGFGLGWGSARQSFAAACGVRARVTRPARTQGLYRCPLTAKAAAARPHAAGAPQARDKIGVVCRCAPVGAGTCAHPRPTPARDARWRHAATHLQASDRHRAVRRGQLLRARRVSPPKASSLHHLQGLWCWEILLEILLGLGSTPSARGPFLNLGVDFPKMP